MSEVSPDMALLEFSLTLRDTIGFLAKVVLDRPVSVLTNSTSDSGSCTNQALGSESSLCPAGFGEFSEFTLILLCNWIAEFLHGFRQEVCVVVGFVVDKLTDLFGSGICALRDRAGGGVELLGVGCDLLGWWSRVGRICR